MCCCCFGFHSTTSILYFVKSSLFLFVLGVIFPGAPSGVEARVQGALLPRHLVILGLLLARQAVPLEKGGCQNVSKILQDLDRPICPVSASSSSARTCNCPARSSAGTFAYVFGVPHEPSRNTWLVLRDLIHATIQ